MEFVEEPVEVEEGGGELIEDEGWAIEVDEWTLEGLSVLVVWRMHAGSSSRILVHWKFTWPDYTLRGRYTYESQREHDQSRDRMRQQSPPKNTDMHTADDQVPEEISSRKSLDHAPSTRVSKHPALPSLTLPLSIYSHHPERETAYRNTLHQ